MRRIKAAVLTAPETIRIQEFEVPDIAANDGLLRIEACGMCGTDYELYYGHIKPGDVYAGRLMYPLILGHEPLGIISGLESKRAACGVSKRVTELWSGPLMQ